MRQQDKAVISLALFWIFICGASAEGVRFKNWYPRYSKPLDTLLDTTCSAQYNAYLRSENGTESGAQINPELSIWLDDIGAGPLIQCLLDASPEIVKAAMSSAGVLLGLMPTILASVGPSTQEIGLLLVVGRRSFLAFLLCLGSPVGYPERSFEVRKHIAEMKERHTEDEMSARVTQWRGSRAFLVVEYIFALAAMANIAQLTWELYFKVSYSITQNAQWFPALWAYLGVMIHALVGLALYIRLTVVDKVDGGERYTYPPFWRWCQEQVVSQRHQSLLSVDVRRPSVFYVLISVFTTGLSACHVLFGTLTFSSILFVNVQDAVVRIFIRYLASIGVCRLIVLNEVSLLRKIIIGGSSADRELVQRSSQAMVNKSLPEDFGSDYLSEANYLSQQRLT